MSSIPSWAGYIDLVILFLVLLPLGAALLRLAERLIGHRFRLLLTERVLLSFFASGGILYLFATLPVPVYGLPLVVGLLVVGAIGYVILVIRDPATDVRTTIAALRSWPILAVALGTLGLLALEVSSGSLLLPNGVDGAVHALFVNEILRNHSVPETLAPFAADGVIYPLGAPVWMTVPVLLFGWPIVSAPVLLPSLFASLSVAAGFSLGERLSGESPSGTPWAGLLFAAFFGLLASWPRFYVGGSYDFIFALPLFVVALGLLRSWVSTGLNSGRSALVLGLFLGTITALNAAVGVSLMLLIVGWILVFRRGAPTSLGSTMFRFLGAVGVAAFFVIRSFIGVVLWFGYPGHVLTGTGATPYAPLVTGSVYGGWVEMLDPLVPFKWRVSPIPALSLELQVLLVMGIALSLWLLIRPPSELRRYLSPQIVRWLGVSTVILFAETSLLLALGSVNSSVSGIQSVTNVWETSILLFLFFQLFAVLPLLTLTNFLRLGSDLSRRSAPPGTQGSDEGIPFGEGPDRTRANVRSGRSSGLSRDRGRCDCCVGSGVHSLLSPHPGQRDLRRCRGPRVGLRTSSVVFPSPRCPWLGRSVPPGIRGRERALPDLPLPRQPLLHDSGEQPHRGFLLECHRRGACRPRGHRGLCDRADHQHLPPIRRSTTREFARLHDALRKGRRDDPRIRAGSITVRMRPHFLIDCTSTLGPRHIFPLLGRPLPGAKPRALSAAVG